MKAYDIEQQVFSGRFRCHRYPADGMSVAEQQAAVNQLVAHFGVDPIKVKRTNGGSRKHTGAYAWKDGRQITMPASFGVAVVCHEVAHILAPEDAHHNEVWRAWFVDCVRVLLGDYHAKRLANAFERGYAPKPRRRKPTESWRQNDGLDDLRELLPRW